MACGSSLRQISRDLGRAPSTVTGSAATVAAVGIGPHTDRRARRAAGARSAVAWRRTRRCVTRWPPSSRSNGRRSRSPAGCADVS